MERKPHASTLVQYKATSVCSNTLCMTKTLHTWPDRAAGYILARLAEMYNLFSNHAPSYWVAADRKSSQYSI